MKTVLFVPGYQEDMKSRDYASTIRAIETQGYKVKFVPINWNRTTIDQWVDELDVVYSKYDPKQTILAGFSFGAMTAFVAAAKRNPFELWLFSMSPYFAEDIASPHMKKSWLNIIGHRRVTAFSKLNFKKSSSKISCKVLVFVGEIEINKWPDMNERNNAAHRLLQNNELIIIQGVGHDVANSHYIEVIKQSI
jgi:pimeloyl-ACP methyl ester carboxylesterase